MSAPISLRNIPPAALHIVHCLCKQTGLSMADLLRQAIVSGLLVEATRFAPAPDGTLGGLEAAVLAKALRRHLSSAIDLLIEYGELPYQGRGTEKPRQERKPMLMQAEESSAAQPEQGQGLLFEDAIGDDLEALGIGMSLAETQGQGAAFPNEPA
jgi:hypothetical protein